MPSTILHYGRAGAEDLEIGLGTFEASMSDGRKVTLHKINLSSFIFPIALDNAVYFTDGAQIGQDSDFAYDSDTGQLTVSGGLLRVGSSGTAVRTLHVAQAGEVMVRIENNSLTTGNVGLEFAINGSVDWNVSTIDGDNDNLVFSAGPAISSTPHFTLFRDTTAVAIGTRTPNTFSQGGLTIHQGGLDDHAIDLKSSDVAHGVTDNADTDTYAYGTKYSGTQGGLLWVGVSEGTIGMGITGVVSGEVMTTADTSSSAIALASMIKIGSGTAVMSDSANLLGVRNFVTTVFLIKGDGDVHNSGGATAMGTYDDYDDVKLLQAVKGAMDVSYKQRFGEWINEHTEVLEQHGVITRSGDAKWFISQRGWRGLLVDTITQLSKRIESLEDGARGTPERPTISPPS